MALTINGIFNEDVTRYLLLCKTQKTKRNTKKKNSLHKIKLSIRRNKLDFPCLFKSMKFHALMASDIINRNSLKKGGKKSKIKIKITTKKKAKYFSYIFRCRRWSRDLLWTMFSQLNRVVESKLALRRSTQARSYEKNEKDMNVQDDEGHLLSWIFPTASSDSFWPDNKKLKTRLRFES